jgi:peptide/bleomycin uptake transporter
MFSSFFPNPKLFFPAAIVWAALCMALWYLLARDWGPQLSLGGLVGFPYPPGNADGAAVAVETARNIWLYQYMIVTGGLFVALVGWLLPQRWFRWSVAVSALIVFLLWFQVQLDVMINAWFGTFYNMVQQALAKPGAITQSSSSASS